MEGKELQCPCLSTGGLCCFVLFHCKRSLPLSVSQILLSLLTVGAFLSFSTSPVITHCLCICRLCSCLLFFSFSVLLLCRLYVSDSISVNSPPPPGHCCAVATHRSDQDRWSRMISGLYSFLQEPAWYCCWHAALTGCLQVQHRPHPVVCNIHSLTLT